MAFNRVDRRFKSTPDILEEVASNKATGRIRCVPEDRYRTYTFKDLQQEKQKFAKKHEQKKSQNFLKRLLASLEKKNVACKADDEFVTEYYRRNDYSNPNSDYLDERLQNVKKNSNKTFLENHPRPNLVSKKLPTVVCDEKNEESLLEDFTVENKVEKLLQRHSVDLANSRRWRRSRNDLNKNTLERIFTDCKEECDGKDSKKKHDRKRSFKDLLGSMIKWRKSGRKEKPRRFVSCDHLTENTKTFYDEHVKQLSRSSLNTVVLEDCEKRNIIQIETRNATIRPIYGAARNEQLLDVLSRNKENRRIFMRNGSVENLVKPSAIKDIVKRISQPLDNSWNDDRITTRWK